MPPPALPNVALDAECLLAATGLLQRPDDTSRKAAQVLLADLKRDLLAVLEQDDPKRLGSVVQTTKYHGKLAGTPPYEAMFSELEDAGEAFAAAYQAAHGNARQLLLARYPSSDLDGIFGTLPVEPDWERLCQWLLEADTVENQRLVADLGAAAVLGETVEVFAGAFPLMYAQLRKVLNDRLAELKRKKWSPPPWLETALVTFMRLPVDQAPPAPPAPTPKPSRVKLDTERLETAADKG
jgi:hypothetical protein